MSFYQKKPKVLPLRPIEIKEAGTNLYPKADNTEVSEDKLAVSVIQERAGEDSVIFSRRYQIILAVLLLAIALAAFAVGFMLFKDEIL